MKSYATMSNNRLQIKLSTNWHDWPLLLQTPGSRGTWDNCDFYMTSTTPDPRAYDWWVIFEGVATNEQALCPTKNTILITAEPSHIKTYDSKFLQQFNTIITTQRKITAPTIIYKQLLPWYMGAHIENNKIHNSLERNYDALRIQNIIQKTKLLSVISSSKKTTPGHRQRLHFIQLLKKHFGDRIDVFGHGGKPLADKWDAIAPYRYHIVLENGVEQDYWTEKLADTFLGLTYPIYYGCPNINSYFSKDSLSCIDISESERAINIIKKIIQENMYEKSIEQIAISKEKILNQYQMFPQLCEIINELEKKRGPEEKKYMQITPEIIPTDTWMLRQIGKVGIFIKKYSPSVYSMLKMRPYKKDR